MLNLARINSRQFKNKWKKVKIKKMKKYLSEAKLKRDDKEALKEINKRELNTYEEVEKVYTDIYAVW